ncbi:helix-turn-helix domain-containing protein [Desulfovibrio mangrovi]|uniref:MerR family transcriptional regulator n=1 Tax=Desulfovibrio mangrovi TaxID=2976983 RepID=UPI002246A9CC|nr:MerR family transcriptional regulator [Desulfovibrio mangrovi]UZP66575.1 helix-turn-helix domain-containing protein [Desulfovibrio mangrovi]
MSDNTLTHRDLGRMLGVSETTIKSYRRKFPDCIPVANDGKPIRFTREAGKVCLRIRELFSRGMSVPEVRTRLEKEYSWIPPLPEEMQDEEIRAAEPVMPAGPVEVELPEDYTQALSNLAKSMVNLTMKQDAIARRLESMDARLQKLDPQGAGAGSVAGGMGSEMEAWLERATGLLERLEQMAAAPVQASEQGVHQGKVIRIRNAYGDVSEYTMETAAAPTGSGEAGEEPDQQDLEAGEATAGAAERAVDATAAEAEADAGFIFDAEEPAQEEISSMVQEPPRTLLTMPLVIQSPEGEFLGVAGRTRGRFNINDLKAMLMSHYEGNQRFTMQWQLTDNGWLMLLEQKELSDPYSLAVLVEQTTTPRGNNVALIEHLTINGKDENPVEMYNFINRIYEA